MNVLLNAVTYKATLFCSFMGGLDGLFYFGVFVTENSRVFGGRNLDKRVESK